jgi:hypothetical protein
MYPTEALVHYEQAGGRDSEGPRAPGLIFSFLAAHGGSRAGAVIADLCRTMSEGLGVAVLLARFDDSDYSPWRAAEAPRRLDGHTWGAFVSRRGSYDELHAREVHPRQLRPVLEHASRMYQVVCADLTGSKEQHRLEVLRSSESIFVVTGSGTGSLEIVREKRDWLRSIDLAERCGLLLRAEPEGVGPAAAEEITGLPVSGLIGTTEQLRSLAALLSEPEVPAKCYALAG